MTCDRQTVFYTPTTLTISEGEKIQGRLTCAPNARNNRDLDITIAYKNESDPEQVVEYKMCVILLCTAANSTCACCGRTLTGCQVVIHICIFSSMRTVIPAPIIPLR
jgi:hypothetical protein